MAYGMYVWPYGRAAMRNFTMLKAISRVPRRPAFAVAGIRRLTDKPKEVYTRINDQKDPARNEFFQYTWGSWLKNDKVQKARRETQFSIEGVTKLVAELQKGDGTLAAPKPLDNGTFALESNWTTEALGDGDLTLKSIASIHEGKHHRVYKLTLANSKELVLRIPYKLESDFAIESKIKSEVATLDFLALKLGLSVPKVFAYGTTRSNTLRTPFILMDYIKGDLLMKQWDPMVADGPESEAKLKLVIDPIMDFQDKLLSITFNKFGSLYFYNDVSTYDQIDPPYDGESDKALQDRWRIGPSMEQVFFKNKQHLSAETVNGVRGPWPADQPLELITSVAKIHLESLKGRLALAQAGSSSKVENIDELKKQITAFENFKTISGQLLKPTSPSIMNASELFKPRLFAPDLDPMNVIVETGSNTPYFIDFEYSSIKPFILASYPSFVAYQGAKIYNLEEDIPGYNEMEEAEKQQYQFMYFKTRNERLWELALNGKRHDLIAVASPHIKVLKAPYLQALECKNDKDYLYVENAVVQLQAMWKTYVENEMVNATDSEFPIEYNAAYVDAHQSELEKHQLEYVSTPFAATGGWVPQDMFNVLKEQNLLVDDGEGNYTIDTEAALSDPPKEQ